MTAAAAAETIDDARQRLLAERRTGIGGSDAGAIVGLDQYRSPFSVYLEKRGVIEPEDLSDNESVEWGILHEDTIAKKYARLTGRRVARVNRLLRHPDFDFIIGHIDRKVIGEPRGLEVKTAGYWAGNSDAWGEAGTDEVPPPYLLQCQHYMGLTGWPVWDLAALIAGSKFRVYTIQRDEDLIAELFAREAELWACVQSGEVPMPSFSREEALEKFPYSESVEIEATEEIARAVLAYRDAKAQIKAAELVLEGASGERGLYTQIADFMGRADTLTWNRVPIMTWKTRSTGERFDAKRHQADHPDCHAQYLAEGSARVMLPKKAFEL